MKTIGDLLSRDLKRKIVEVIQVDADKDEDLYSEITEYIATDSIKDGLEGIAAGFHQCLPVPGLRIHVVVGIQYRDIGPCRTADLWRAISW